MSRTTGVSWPRKMSAAEARLVLFQSKQASLIRSACPLFPAPLLPAPARPCPSLPIPGPYIAVSNYQSETKDVASRMAGSGCDRDREGARSGGRPAGSAPASDPRAKLESEIRD